MAVLTDYMERKLLDHIFGQAAFTRPNGLYLGLSASAFADSDNGTTASAKEPSGNYARVRIDNISEYNTSNHDIRNTSSIDFNEASGSWGDVEYWGIFDGTGSSANMLMHGSFSAATTVSSGDQFRISTGDLEINFPSAIYVGANSTYTDNHSEGTTDHYVKAKWRYHIAYALGFLSSYSNLAADEKFLFYSSAVSGSYSDSSRNHHTNLYLAVRTSAFPTSGLTGSEISQSGTNYARVNILSAYDSSIDYFSAATTSSGTTSISNDKVIQFQEATSSWGNISHFAIFRGDTLMHSADERVSNQATSMYPLISGALTSTKTVGSGDRLRFGIGDLVITAS